ncbi:MAG TPA: hypothetical protein VGB62_08320 [Allosphingosinicella sp.]|jgi:hypothetical protein
MKTPYDGALRVRQREIDRIGAAIGDENGRLGALEAAQRHADAAAAAEVRLASADPMLSTHAYLARMRLIRERIEQDRATSAARLDALRDQATDAFGGLRAMQSAADSYKAEQARVAAVAEQALADDISTAALLRARRGAAREQSA